MCIIYVMYWVNKLPLSGYPFISLYRQQHRCDGSMQRWEKTVALTFIMQSASTASLRDGRPCHGHVRQQSVSPLMLQRPQPPSRHLCLHREQRRCHVLTAQARRRPSQSSRLYGRGAQPACRRSLYDAFRRVKSLCIHLSCIVLRGVFCAEIVEPKETR